MRMEVTTSSCFWTMTLGGFLQESGECRGAVTWEGELERAGIFTAVGADMLTTWTRVVAAPDREGLDLPNNGTKAAGMVGDGLERAGLKPWSSDGA